MWGHARCGLAREGDGCPRGVRVYCPSVLTQAGDIVCKAIPARSDIVCQLCRGRCVHGIAVGDLNRLRLCACVLVPCRKRYVSTQRQRKPAVDGLILSERYAVMLCMLGMSLHRLCRRKSHGGRPMITQTPSPVCVATLKCDVSRRRRQLRRVGRAERRVVHHGRGAFAHAAPFMFGASVLLRCVAILRDFCMCSRRLAFSRSGPQLRNPQFDVGGLADGDYGRDHQISRKCPTSSSPHIQES